MAKKSQVMIYLNVISGPPHNENNMKPFNSSKSSARNTKMETKK